jgi:hypothetical protein
MERAHLQGARQVFLAALEKIMGGTAVVHKDVVNCACGWKAGSGMEMMDQGSAWPGAGFSWPHHRSQNSKKQTMKMILEKLRSLLRSGPGTSRVFWQQTEFTFTTRRRS